MFKILTFPF